MTYAEAERYIHSFEKFGWDLTLDRLRMLLDRLGNPQNHLTVLHVAGTNGKGSVSNLCANALTEAGYKTGLYTSPFVVDFRERFQINGQMIPKETFARLTAVVQTEIQALEQSGTHITEFEAITAIAFLWFSEEACDYTVLEVGLGGRFDATNVIQAPAVCGIVSISLDHTNILGDTIEQIAGEKAGIIKEGVPCCCYPLMNPKALAVLQETANALHAPLIQPSMNDVLIDACTDHGSRFTAQGVPYTLRLVGKHQIANALTALAMLCVLRDQGAVIPNDAIQRGFEKTAFPGRFEILSQEPLIVDDGAHNEEGTAALAATLSGIDKEKYVLMGMLADKDYVDSLAHIGAQADHLYCVPVQNPRALPPEELAKAARRFCKNVLVFSSCQEAVDAVFEKLQPKDMLLGCGSLYLVGELRTLFLEKIKQ
jgi:dihydrofolate synthase/folylpolyglutamate synthase